MAKSNYVDKALLQIYEEVYATVSNKIFNIFLCGSGLDSSSNCFHCHNFDKGSMKPLRHQLQLGLECKKDMKTLFAENVFMGLVDLDSSFDFLELENMLAYDNQVDVVVIALESVGSFVELGAFSNIPDLRKKLLIIANDKFKYDESFISLGPIKVLLRENKDQVIYTNGNIGDETIKKIVKYTKKRSTSNTVNLNSIMTLYYFLQLYFYFFSPVKEEEIFRHVTKLIGEKEDNFEVKVKAAINLLKKENIIKQNEKSFYNITKDGFKLIKEIKSENKLKFSDRYLFDKIRTSILNNKLRINYKKYYAY